MNSQELYHLLTNFEAESLLQFGLSEVKEGRWALSDSKTQYTVSEGWLRVYRAGVHIIRLDVEITNPAGLYHTLLDEGLIPAGEHKLNLRNLGLDV